MSQYDNLRDYKREKGITARLRKPIKQRFNPAPCLTCGYSHFDHTTVLRKERVCNNYQPTVKGGGSHGE